MRYIVLSAGLQNPDRTLRAAAGTVIDLDPRDPSMEGQWHLVAQAPAAEPQEDEKALEASPVNRMMPKGKTTTKAAAAHEEDDE